jgi:hypothetical protein
MMVEYGAKSERFDDAAIVEAVAPRALALPGTAAAPPGRHHGGAA